MGSRRCGSRECRDDQRHVSATPLTMVPIGSTYDIPAYRGDTSWVTGAVGINGLVTPNISVSAGYWRVESRSGIDEDGLHGMVQVRF